MWVYVTEGTGIEALQILERPMLSLGPTQVLVKMKAVALNYRDLLVIKGIDSWKPPEPRIPVSDGVGMVVATGGDVTRVQVGDRVAGIFLPQWIDGALTAETYVSPLGGVTTDGVLAEYRIFDEQSVVVVPTHLRNAEAATLPVAALTAWHAVRYRSQVQPGDVVLIQGTGGVSLFALQFVLALGGRAIVLSSSDEKLDKLRALGTHEVINYKQTPEWDKEVLTLTDDRGVDHVIEVVGGDNLNRSLRGVRVSGTISFIGLLAGLSAPIDTYAFVTRNIRLHGIETGSRAMFEDMNRFIEQHALHPILDKVYVLADVHDALRQLEAGAHFGKIAVALPPDD